VGDQIWLQNTLILTVAGSVAFLVSFVLTPLIRRFALKRGLVVPPAPRRVHKIPTPRIGGIAIFIGFLLAVLSGLAVSFLVNHFWRSDDLWRIVLVLIGATFIAVISAIDDLRPLSAGLRLVCHFLAAFLLVIPQLINPDGRSGIIIDIFNNPFGGVIDLRGIPILAITLTLFWIVGMMNTVNWADGLDGLAGGIIFLGASLLFLENLLGGRNSGLQITSSIIALALAASVAGFMPFNWHPAKIFMGDCGAMFLGYVLAVIAIIDGAKVATALLVMGLPILDAIWVVVSRIRNGRGAGVADKSHLHHRLLELGYTQRQIVIFYYIVVLAFGLTGIFIQHTWAKIFALTIMVLIIVPFIAYSVYSRVKMLKKQSTEVTGHDNQSSIK
jgi:UDP-N-acetylmuramyl pentapeptide phosphotransferase/UDP-N-acetylglucosamine-1-phosphate transferase